MRVVLRKPQLLPRRAWFALFARAPLAAKRRRAMSGGDEGSVLTTRHIELAEGELADAHRTLRPFENEEPRFVRRRAHDEIAPRNDNHLRAVGAVPKSVPWCRRRTRAAAGDH